MATSVKISNLPPGNFIQSQDEFPVSRSGETFRIAASQLVTEGENVTTSPGLGFVYGGFRTAGTRRLLYRPLSGIQGISVNTIGDTVVISASGQNPTMSNFIGNGSTVTFALNEPRSINPNNYRVDIDGVLQKPQEDYNIVGSNLVFTPQSVPPLNTRITVVSNNLVNVYDMIPSDGTVTTNKIFNNAVSTTKIADNAITTPKLSAQVVTNEKLAFDGGAFAFRNKLINGDFRIDQRNGGATVTYNGTNNGTINADRWNGGISGSGSFTARQTPFIPGDMVFKSNLTNLQFTHGLRLINSGPIDRGYIAQHIEDVYTFAGQTVTLSFHAYGTTVPPNGQCYVYLRQYFGVGGSEAIIVSPGNQFFTITNNPVRVPYSFTFTVPSILGKTIGPNSSLQLIIVWSSTAAANWSIAGVQLEEGPTATPFEHRPIGTELALCQRYYEKSYNLNTIPGTAVKEGNSYRRYSYVDTLNGEYDTVTFKVPKRTTNPTVRIYSSRTGTINRVGDDSDGVDLNLRLLYYNSENAVTVNFFLPNQYSAIAYQWTADSEL
jgi:hypothetical protein